ncbi:Crp/Fnr family transcriptional regulator [Chryseobacterium gambrini]|uniref:Crp/Fnr family transcriptional regulator n=1 Tax=Chryseobacterium gambrini TaxID=373672 RepID=A0AAJ1R732_9FLAO|nr:MULTISPECIES: Crp/Fnr family transcriptional regulator [Chryseobacterium]MDN4014908.1 Crp/Fnr family transcriptional regulator [Chryseobacterium gambrini]QWA39557.1 Crp/Fnr family transcriptional regulator [Chryseobacterium sp. ZHDP1]
MIINENLLIRYGAEYIDYEANQPIFQEGTTPKFYFQIVEGIVELNNLNDDGREFTQNILTNGQCLGEYLLFNERVYPMSAITQTACTVIKLHKDAFFDLLQKNPNVFINIIKCLSDRLYYKSIMLFNISLNNPTQRLQTLLEYFHNYNLPDKQTSNHVPFTRKQLASLTGLRVETVIRTVKKMEKERILKIENRKIYYL